MVFPSFFFGLPGRVSLQPTLSLSWRLASNCQININVYFDTQGTVSWTLSQGAKGERRQVKGIEALVRSIYMDVS